MANATSPGIGVSSRAAPSRGSRIAAREQLRREILREEEAAVGGPHPAAGTEHERLAGASPLLPPRDVGGPEARQVATHAESARAPQQEHHLFIPRLPGRELMAAFARQDA